MYVRESQAGQCQHHELRVQPHPGDCHQARDQGDCGHSAEQPGPGQIFAVNIQFTCQNQFSLQSLEMFRLLQR